MRDVCNSCRYAKPYSQKYVNCVKYGCPIRKGRTYCISWERTESNVRQMDTEQVWEPEDGSGWDPVRLGEGGEEIR